MVRTSSRAADIIQRMVTRIRISPWSRQPVICRDGLTEFETLTPSQFGFDADPAGIPVGGGDEPCEGPARSNREVSSESDQPSNADAKSRRRTDSA